MSFRSDSYDQALTRAAVHARAWLESVSERPVGPRATAAELLAAFGGPLPDGPTPPEDVVDMLAALSEPGLMAMQSGRFFGWVIGGTLPAALAADWLVSAWDQNTGMRYATPATATAEEAAAAWLLELLGLPDRSRRRLRDGRDDGELHLPRGRPDGGALAARVGRRARRARRCTEGPRPRRRRAA